VRTGIAWDRIEQFVGYGRVDAPVVFLGMEEGQSSSASLESDLVYRSQFEPIIDLQTAHRGIDGTGKFFDPVGGSTQRTWRPMCELMIRRQDAGGRPNRQSRLRYQALQLGRSHGDSLLTELLPYPKRTAEAWPEIYGQRFRTRALYEQHMLPYRIELLSRLLAGYRRELVICYGKANWSSYKQLANVAFGVGVEQWPAVPSDGALTVVAGGVRIVLTKHFSARDFNTDEQLRKFVNVALHERGELTGAN